MNETIRIKLFSLDSAFSEIIGRTLGPDFLVHFSNLCALRGERKGADGFDVILLDLDTMENGSTINRRLRLMDDIRQFDPYTPIIAMVGYGDDDLARAIIEKGAFDTLASPPNMADLRLLLRRAYRCRQVEKELNLLRQQRRLPGRFGDMIGASEEMSRTLELVRKVASCDINVLITGETGTGKNLLARTIHQLSSRCAGPFVEFSCANLPETLVEDGLFGHEKGAFTDAITVHRGRFEMAEGGTLLLDEIGDLALCVQAKLLRVLQQCSFERLGGSRSFTTNVRVICATHRNLEGLAEQGGFRKDLYFRLNVVQVHLPSLRERREEIPVLAHHFLSFYARQFHKDVKGFSPVAMDALEEYFWPGNVRELENAVQRAIVMAEGIIEIWHLPKNLRDGFERASSGLCYEEEVRDFKRRLILRSLRECGGRKSEVARALGVDRSYLHRLINQLQILSPEGLAGEVSETLSSRPRLV
jgi:DNA-binding NtrC family response regulator